MCVCVCETAIESRRVCKWLCLLVHSGMRSGLCCVCVSAAVWGDGGVVQSSTLMVKHVLAAGIFPRRRVCVCVCVCVLYQQRGQQITASLLRINTLLQIHFTLSLSLCLIQNLNLYCHDKPHTVSRLILKMQSHFFLLKMTFFFFFCLLPSSCELIIPLCRVQPHPVQNSVDFTLQF